jgi:C_GCAxxG_C_C family probable redox protein
MTDFSAKATELFNNGYSCSEAIVRGAYETGIIDQEIDIELINQVAQPFSGGMSSGCICGAVAGAQIVLGLLFGRKNLSIPSKYMKNIAAEFIDKFKEKRKTTCCRALSAGFGDDQIARRANCVSIVKDAAEIIEEIMFVKSPEKEFLLK